MSRSLYQKALWCLTHTESHDSLKQQQPLAKPKAVVQVQGLNMCPYTTQPVQHRQRIEPWMPYQPGNALALGKANETRASATVRWLCWCLSHALCTGCQAEAPRALPHGVAEKCYQPPRSICCWPCTECEKGFLVSPEFSLAQQECGFAHPPYSSAITS